MEERDPAASSVSYIEVMLVAVVVAALGLVALSRYRQADTLSDYATVISNFDSVRQALEAYKIDTGEFPETDMGTTDYAAGYRTLHRVTTPIAYISSIPVSPFTETFGTPGAPRVGTANNTMLYVRKVYFDGLGGVDSNYKDDVRSYAFNSQPAIGLTTVNMFLESSDWELKSIGPDGIDDRNSIAPGYGGYARVYDPTNGTISRGDIVWFSNLHLSQPVSGAAEWKEYN